MEKLCFILCVFGLVACDTVASNEQGQRKPKFLTFNSVNDDFKIDLEFSIPFLSIPVKKFMHSLHPGLGGSPSINVNTGALVLGGVFILTTTVILPLLMKHQAAHYRDERLSRALESAQFGIDSILDAANQLLLESDKLSGCPQRVACWMGKGKEYPMALWTQISSDPLISLLVNTSSIEEAVSSGRKGLECSKYVPCPLTEDQSEMFSKNLEVLTNSYKLP